MAKILVVDDVPSIRRSVTYVLRSAGYDVEEASNGYDAMQMILAAAYSLVLTDILMPQMDGGEVIQQLRSMNTPPKVIAMSGGGGPTTAEQALQMARTEADGVLLKPFARTQLLEAVDRVLH